MKNSGSKMSLGEYATRKLIDVGAAIAAPVATAAVGYVIYFHGHDIAERIKNRSKK